MRSVSSIELRDMIARGEDVQLIDVREPFEHEHYNIGANSCHWASSWSMPANWMLTKQWLSIVKRYPKCDRHTTPATKFPTLRLVNLSGGMYAWRKEMLDL